MRKLSNCDLYNSYVKFKPKIMDVLNKDPNVFQKYVVPFQYYESWLNILSTKKYPLLRPTLKMAKNRQINLFNFADPFDPSAQPMILHPSISVKLSINQKKEIVSFVNAAEKSGYVRNNDKEPVGLKIDENHLYAYLQSGFTGILLAKKDREITENVKLQTIMAEIYAGLLAAICDKIYPISSETNGYQKLTFLCAMFYLQYMAEYDIDKALTLALKVKTVDPIIVGNESKALQLDKLKMNSFQDFIESMKTEFPFINPKEFSLAAIAQQFTKRYGPASFFALEHFQTLLNLIQHVGLRTNVFADFNLSKMIPNSLIEEVNKILLLISGD